MDNNTIAQGLGARFTVTLRDTNGDPYGGYTGTEALAGSVRVGRDSPPIFAPSLAWIDATLGTISVVIAGSDTATLDPGRYLVRIELADDTAHLYEGSIDVAWSPGTALALPTYCSFADILDRAPWVEKLQRDTDLAGFARQRHQARKWFDDLLHRHYRYSGGTATDFAFVPGISFGGQYAGTGYWRDGRRSRELQVWLDADGLDVTEAVIDATSNYVIALLCDRQVTPARDDGTYSAAARKYFARAENAAMDITAEIDSDADSINDVTIRLGVYDTLEG